MKTFLVTILLLASLQGFSQKKNKNAPIAPDPKDLKIDSLTKVNGQYSKTLDSVSRERTLYLGVYTAVKDKVLLRDFDPQKIGQIIDSLKTGKDATINGLTAASTSLTDSLSALTKQNMELKKQLESKTQLMAELKQLKDLLDSKMISQADYDAKKKLVMDKWQ